MVVNEMILENIPKRTILLVVLAMILSGCTKKASQETDPRSIVFPFQYIGNIDKAHLDKPYYQPSGICFHSKRGTLFVVGNLGEVCEMRTDGTVIKEKRIKRADFEGITHDPSTGLLSGLYFDRATGHLYVISDSTNTIFEFTRTGTLLSGHAFPGDNQEGITVDDQGFLYIAQDSGGILKIKWKK